MNPREEQLERIVAYLDGELPPEESADVERLLASDEQFRQDLQGAERAWAALDQLPMTTVDDEFARTTMEMVVTAARQDVEAQTLALPVQRRRRRYMTGVLVAMAVLMGALVVRVILQNPNRRLVADLPIIQNVDIYSQFFRVDFLRELHKQLGEEFVTSANEAERLQANAEEFQLVSSDGDRTQWLDALSDEQKIGLRAKLNRFQNLSPDRREEIRALHESLLAADDREQLLETMFRYEQWLSELPPSEQYEYRDRKLTATERATLVATEMKRAAEEMKRAASEGIFKLTPQQLRHLFQEVGPILKQMRGQPRPDMDRNRRDQDTREGDKPRPNGPDEIRGMANSVMTQNFDRFGIAEQLNSKVIASLPPEVGAAYEKLSPRERYNRFRSWANEFFYEMRKAEISEQELADYFANVLEPSDREKLLAKSSDEMQETLRRMYRGQWSPYWRRMSRNDGDRPQRNGGPPEGRRRNGDNGFGSPGSPGPPRDRDGQQGMRRFDEGRPPGPPVFNRGPGDDGPRRRPLPERGPPPEDD